MYYGGMGYYSSMIVLIPAMIFTMIVQGRIKRAYSRYSQVENSRRLTGAQAARMMLDANGLSGVPINILNGGDDLNNYFDPRSNSVNLSQAVYHTDSIAAMCIACHEVGHAIQHATNYAPVRIRNGIVPLVNLTSTFSWPLIMLGLIFSTSSRYGSLLFNLRQTMGEFAEHVAELPSGDFGVRIIPQQRSDGAHAHLRCGNSHFVSPVGLCKSAVLQNAFV